MAECIHQNLVLVTNPSQKLRCSRCHLTIDANELEDGFCPECWEVKGQRHKDFEEISPDHGGGVRYRCEDCGITIDIKEKKNKE